MNDPVNKKITDSKDHLVEIICAKCGGALRFSSKHSRYICTECGHVIPDIYTL